MKIRLGIRTHFYDRCVEYAYHEWQKLLGDDVFLLVDETRGPVDVGDARMLSWTESDAAELGLPLTPEKKVPWYNGDYHIYHMIPHMKDDDFCFLVEHDVFLKVSDRSRLLGLLEKCADYDFIATRIGPRRLKWSWVRDLDSLYTVVHGAAVMIVGFNRRSAEYLLERRLKLQRERIRLGSAQWPMVEAFIGTEVFGLESLKIGDMQVLGGLSPNQLRTTPPYLIDERMENAPPDVLYHPCLPRERILSKFRSIFRTSPPNPRIWNALLPFVSTASEAEMKKLDWLAQKFWDTPSFMAAFSNATIPASVPRRPHTAVDMGELVAFYIRLQRQRESLVGGSLSPVQRRRLTKDHVDLFLRLLEINRIDFACEVGAHEASFSKRAKKRFPTARVIAFEANPMIFDLYQDAVAALGVEFYRLCVADRAGTTSLKVPVGQNGLRETMGSTLDFAGSAGFRSFDCETVSLNEFLSDLEFERGALWVDVEGAASLVFQGAEKILENCVAIYVEVEDRAMWSGQKLDADVFRFLLEFGFVPVAADSQKSWQYNVILIKHEQLNLRPISRAISHFHSRVPIQPNRAETEAAAPLR